MYKRYSMNSDHKTIWKVMISTWLLTGILIMSTLFPAITLAAAENFSGNCQILNNPANINNIVTIIEEPFLTQVAPKQGYVSCFRQTTCAVGKPADCPYETSSSSTNTATGNKTECKSCFVNNCTASNTVTCKRIGVYFANSGTELLYSYVGTIYRWSASTIGIICVFYMVYGGIRISSAGDNSGVIDEAKKKMIQSLQGLVILFASAVILYTINPNFFTI